MENFNKYDLIGYQIGSTANMLRNEVINRLSKKNIEITHAQMLILMMLYNENGKNQNELTNIMKKEKTTIARVIDGMEKKNLIRREKGLDKRNKICYLTDKGKELMNEILPVVCEVNQKAIENITVEEFEVFKKVIEKIKLNFEYQLENKC